jgi:ABC-type uncharacterized transport system ATPase subunit
VLRGGKLVADAAGRRRHKAQLARRWWAAVAAARPEAKRTRRAPVCELQGVTVRGHGARRAAGRRAALRAGEVVAMAGVAGNGQQALADLLCGERRPTPAR